MNKGKGDSGSSGDEPTAQLTAQLTAQPTGEPTTAQPTGEPQVLTFYSVNTDPNVVGPLYNLAVAGHFVDFNDDDQYCTNVDNPTCSTLDHSSCNVYNPYATSIASIPINMSFGGEVDSGSNSCCDAKSCAAVYLDTEPAYLLAGDTFSYTVSF
jgi:hypothetical protein